MRYTRMASPLGVLADDNPCERKGEGENECLEGLKGRTDPGAHQHRHLGGR